MCLHVVLWDALAAGLHEPQADLRPVGLTGYDSTHFHATMLLKNISESQHHSAFLLRGGIDGPPFAVIN